MACDPRISVWPVAASRAVDKKHAMYHVIHEGPTLFRMVLRQELRPGQSSEIHLHAQAAELYIVLRGHLQIRTESAVCDVPEGHAALVPAGVPHGVNNPCTDESTLSVILMGADYTKQDVHPYKEPHGGNND